VRITAIKPQPRHPARVDVHVDGIARLSLAVELVHQLGLAVGEPVDERRLAAAEAADLRWRAREAALTLLGYRARSAVELRRRLLRRGFPAEVVDGIVADLRERGYLDDGAFAASFVRDRAGHRPRGRGRLVQELCARGLEPDEAAQAVEAVFREEGIDEAALASAAARDWLRRGGRRLTGPEARRRLRTYLARRGFFGDSARAALDAVLGRG
jgi:regulatory protein